MRFLYISAIVLAIFFINGCNHGHNNQGDEEHSHEQSEEATASESENNHSHGEETHSHDEESHSHGEETHSHSEAHNQETDDSHEHDDDHKHQDDETNDAHQHEGEQGHSHSEQQRENGHDHSSEEHSHSNGTSNSEKYHVEELKPTSFNEVVKTSGKIKVLPKNQSLLVAPVAGIVQFENNSVLPGKTTTQGERLFRITSKSLAEDNLIVKYEKAKAKFNQAKKDFERAQKLRSDQIISEKEYLQHKTDYLEAKTNYQSIESHVEGNSGSVKSSQTGFVDEVFVEEGDYVKAGEKLARIINNQRLMLKAEVSQKYAAKLDEFTSANFETSDGRLFNTSELNGEVLSLGKSTTRESFYLPVYFAIDNKENYTPGSFVHVYLIGETRENVLVLPKDAFIEDQGNFYVYVRENGEFHKQAVEVGPDDGRKMIVQKGVKAGDHVVMHNAYQLKMEQASSSLPAHGHSH